MGDKDQRKDRLRRLLLALIIVCTADPVCGVAVDHLESTEARPAPEPPYASPSRFTDPGERADMLEALPEEPLEIAAVAANLTIHHNLLPHFDVPRDQWSQVRNVWPPAASGVLAALRDSGPGDLSGSRQVTDRLRGGCMAESHILATLLRHRRIPVRIRAGYFRGVYTNEDHLIAFWEKNAREKGVAKALLDEDPERWLEVNHEYTRAQIAVDKRVEHWVTEYWDAERRAWRLLDANTDFLAAMSDLEVGPHLPRRHFEHAHEAWRKMRSAADFDPDQYAEWPQDGRSHIRSQLLWDFYSLLNHDIAGHDKTAWTDDGQARSAERDAFAFVKEAVYDEMPGEQLAELDALAELLARDPAVDELVAFYRASEHHRLATLEADAYSLPARWGRSGSD